MAEVINLSEKFNSEKGLVLTLGNFDGLHKGHLELINKIKSLGDKSGVMTFSPHPAEVLGGKGKIQQIATLSTLQKKLQQQGVDYLFIEEFTVQLSDTPAETFFLDKIWKPFEPKAIVVGYDFKFGKDRKGDFKLLETLAAKYGFQVYKMEALVDDSDIVSSSLIRQSLQAGQVEEANNLLGSRYLVSGVVVKGEGRGAGLGFRTLNIDPHIPGLLPNGVYITQVEHKGSTYNSITNIGKKPTFHQDFEIQIETHLIDRNINLYGEEIEVSFIKRLRDEKKFESLGQLVSQIGHDVDVAKKFFGVDDEVGGDSH